VRLRDEAHRFAIEFHRKLRGRRHLRSVLEEIPGVGGGRRRALLRHLGSLRRVREATEAELSAVPGVGPAQARAIHDFFHRPGAAVPADPDAPEGAGDGARTPGGNDLAPAPQGGESDHRRSP